MTNEDRAKLIDAQMYRVQLAFAVPYQSRMLRPNQKVYLTGVALKSIMTESGTEAVANAVAITP